VVAGSSPAGRTRQAFITGNHGEGVMLDEKVIEQRLAALERTVAELQRRLDSVSVSTNWIEKVTGSVSDVAAFREALELGRALRHADRPPDEPGT
jgi:hypothetical protein